MNKDKLIEILAIQSESYNQFRMFAYIVRELKKTGCSYYTYNGCIYATKGDSNLYPCIVAHMDTVHDIVENLTPLEINGNITGFNAVTMEQSGIGGDDKVGVFIAFQCLDYFDNIKVVFFRDEEVGCEGSYNSDINFFDNCSCVLQCDRRGNDDFINVASGVKLSSDKFKKDVTPILKSYGYKFNNGMITDVMALKESGISCSMANISCGYYNPHTAQEYVNILDVANCLDMVKNIFSKLGDNYYPCNYTTPIYEKTSIKTDWHNIKSRNWEDDFFGLPEKKENKYCGCCGEIGELKYEPNYNIDICNNCVINYIDTLI